MALRARGGEDGHRRKRQGDQRFSFRRGVAVVRKGHRGHPEPAAQRHFRNPVVRHPAQGIAGLAAATAFAPARRVQTAFSMVPQMAFSVPPGQRWDYYLRLHREAQIEAVAVPVERATWAKCPTRRRSSSKQFFDEYKEVIPRPDSPDPGFHVPQKVDMQYLKAERARFLAYVSDADVRAEYQKSKKRYDKEEQDNEEAERKAEAEQAPKPAPEKKAEPGVKPLPAGKSGSEKKPEPKQSVLEPKTQPQKPSPAEKPVSKKEAEPEAKAEAKDRPNRPRNPTSPKAPRRSPRARVNLNPPRSPTSTRAPRRSPWTRASLNPPRSPTSTKARGGGCSLRYGSLPSPTRSPATLRNRRPVPRQRKRSRQQSRPSRRRNPATPSSCRPASRRRKR